MARPQRTFTVKIGEDGSLVVARTNGKAFDEADRKFVYDSIAAALRQRNLDIRNAERAVNKEGEPPRTEGMTFGGTRFEIDGMVIELEKRRSWVQGLSKAQLARELGWYANKVTDIFRGATRPHLSEIRDIGAIPGINVVPMLIPSALVSHVKELKERYDRREGRIQ